MSEVFEQMPEGWIEDRDKAEEVAYASKEQRSLVVANQLVASVVSANISEDGQLSIVDRAKMAQGLFDLYGTYPEAFKHVGEYGKDLTVEMVFADIPKILKEDGMPLRSTEHWSYRGVRSSELVAEAEIREVIAEALYDTPPSDDFLRDYDDQRGPRFSPYDVDKVHSLLRSASEYYDISARKDRDLSGRFDRYREKNLDRDLSNSRYKAVINLMDYIWTEITTHIEDPHYVSTATAILNLPTSTIEDIEALYKRGQEIIVNTYKQRAAHNQLIHEMIISGQAALYVSPTTKDG